MNKKESLFFCAVGGSGMLPLAMIMKARGADVSGSDRSHDQKRTPQRFAFIEKQGIRLFPQNGSGLSGPVDRMIVSTAVEKTVPDYLAATQKGVTITHRAALLAEIANAATTSIVIAGTSGKSTTTGMTGWIMHAAARQPTIVNGAVMKNFASPDSPFASAVVGDPDLIVVEADESDGSIAQFTPTIAVLNNIAVDHKSLGELRDLFTAFVRKAKYVVINADHAETAPMISSLPPERTITFSLKDKKASLAASEIDYRADSVAFNVTHGASKQRAAILLPVPGAHNVANALAALGAAMAAGVPFDVAAKALESFAGIARRMDVIGSARGITVIDDFAHNPDKIAATLRTLRQSEGRLQILFQPHGYGPLPLLRDGLIDSFVKGLLPQDRLYLCDPLYLGGTVTREVTSADLVAAMAAKGLGALYRPKREDCASEIIRSAQKGDRIVIMGARDDTLPELAKEILYHLGN